MQEPTPRTVRQAQRRTATDNTIEEWERLACRPLLEQVKRKVEVISISGDGKAAHKSLNRKS
jgi:hypothetical protein